jgi:hypothetical protein
LPLRGTRLGNAKGNQAGVSRAVAVSQNLMSPIIGRLENNGSMTPFRLKQGRTFDIDLTAENWSLSVSVVSTE